MLDKLLVIDLECTCWEDRPYSADMEIIEIGLVEVDIKTLIISPSVSIIVKPKYSEVSEFCTKLTTLTQKDVDKGISFEEACNTLINSYKIDKRVWASWGNFDREHFTKECLIKNVPYPFGKNHLNLSNLFALKFGLNKSMSVSKALKHCGLDFDGTPHRGNDDAHNIAKLYLQIMWKQFVIKS